MLNRAKFINYIHKNWIIFVFSDFFDSSITNNKNPLRNSDAIQTKSSDFPPSSLFNTKRNRFDILPFKTKKILTGTAIIHHLFDESDYGIKVFSELWMRKRTVIGQELLELCLRLTIILW